MLIAVDARPLVTRHISGAEQHARNIVAQWAAAKPVHRFLLLFDKSARENFDDSLLASLPGNFEEVLISSFHIPSRWLLGSRALSAIERTLRRYQVDIYHSFSPAIPRTRACPVVQTIHDLSFELDPMVRRAPRSAHLRRLTRSGVQRARRVIAVSSQTKQDIAAIYNLPLEKIEVVHNGINPAFVPAQRADLRAALAADAGLKPPYLLAVGADIPRRNYERMATAMEDVWKRHPNLCWALCGRGDWKDTPLYRRAVKSASLGRMVFISSPSDERLAQLYRDATLTVCASSFEGFGLSVLESLACGTPVACSDMRSLREVADNAAVYFPHDDPATMGLTINRLIEDVEYRRQLKHRGLQRAANFTWPKAAQLLLDTLETVHREHTGG